MEEDVVIVLNNIINTAIYIMLHVYLAFHFMQLHCKSFNHPTASEMSMSGCDCFPHLAVKETEVLEDILSKS